MHFLDFLKWTYILLCIFIFYMRLGLAEEVEVQNQAMVAERVWEVLGLGEDEDELKDLSSFFS